MAVLVLALCCALPAPARAHDADTSAASDPNATGSTERHAIADGLLAPSDQEVRDRVLLNSLGLPTAAPVAPTLRAYAANEKGTGGGQFAGAVPLATDDAPCQSTNRAQLGAWSCPVTPQYPTTGPFTRDRVQYRGDPIVNTAQPYEFDLYHNITAGSQANSRYWSPNPRIVPVFEAMLPDGKILFWDWYFSGVMDDANQTTKPGTRVLLWDPAHPERPGVRQDYYGANLFCAGYSQLANGDVLLAGGNANAAMAGINQTFIYHWRSGTWERSQNMARDRWYPAVTTLSNGEAMILGGDPRDDDPNSYYYEPGDAFPEVFASGFLQNPAQTWDPNNPAQHLRSLSAVAGKIESWRLYPQNFASVDGRVLYAGSEPKMQLIDPRGSGSVTNFGNRDQINRVYGAGVYYANGRVLVAGGGQPAKYSFAVPPANRGPGWSGGSGWVCFGHPWGDPAIPATQIWDRSACLGNNTVVDANEHGATASATKIDLTHDGGPNSNQGIPSAAATSPMIHPRRMNYLTVLPDGSVLATGGLSTTDSSPNPALDGTNDNSNHTLVNYDAAVNAAERWNPQTGQWAELASASIPREYHSTAILLPDARVLQGGGGVCGACVHYQYSEANFQYFYPPYLFNADGSLKTAAQRPRITGPFVSDGDKSELLAPIDYAGSLTFSYAQATGAVPLAKAALVRLGTPTHSTDQGQRYIPVELTVNSPSSATIAGPDNSYEAPAGFYMLFLIDQNGTPSVARMVQVGASLALANVPSVVSVWAATNRGGASQDLGLGRFTASGGNLAQVGDDQIESLKIRAGHHADLCTGGDFSGCTTLAAGTYNTLPAALTNSISSIRVFDGDAPVPPVAPSITTPAGPDAITNSAQVTISGGAEGDATVKLFDGTNQLAQTTASGSGSWSIPLTLDDGSHTLTARAQNTAGTSPASSALTLTVDTVAPAAPQLTLVEPTSSLASSKSARVAVSGESGAKFFGRLDGAAFAQIAPPVDLAGLADGEHHFVAYQTDAAGNSSSTAEVSWSVDTTPPLVTISDPQAGEHTSDPLQAVTFSVSDAHPAASSSCSFNAGPAVACDSSAVPPAELPVGQNTASVTHTDTAGNSATAAVTFYVDAPPPTGPTTDPSGPTTEPSGPTSDPSGPTSEPSGPTSEPSGPTTEPPGPTDVEPTPPTTNSVNGNSAPAARGPAPHASPARAARPSLRVRRRVRNKTWLSLLVRCPTGCRVTARFIVRGRTTHAASKWLRPSPRWQRVSIMNRRRHYLARRIAEGDRVILRVRAAGQSRRVRVVD